MSGVLTLPLIFKRMDFFHFFLKPFDSFLTIPCKVRKNNQLLSCSACFLSSSANFTPCLKLYDIGPLHRKAWGLHYLWQDEYHSCFLLLPPSPFSVCRCPSNDLKWMLKVILGHSPTLLSEHVLSNSELCSVAILLAACSGYLVSTSEVEF